MKTNRIILAALGALIACEVRASENLSSFLLERGAVAESRNASATAFYEVNESEDCGGKPCPRLLISAGIGNSWGASLSVRPLPFVVIEGGVSDNTVAHSYENIYVSSDKNNYSNGSSYGGLFGAVRFSLLKDYVEIGGRYQPFRASNMTRAFNEKFRDLGYDVHVNFYRTEDRKGKVYLAISGLKRNWAPNLFQIGGSLRIR